MLSLCLSLCVQDPGNDKENTNEKTEARNEEEGRKTRGKATKNAYGSNKVDETLSFNCIIKIYLPVSQLQR